MDSPKKSRGTYVDVKLLALAAVESPDLDYFTRQVHRAFSTTFHVSLFEAETHPLEELLRHLYEHKFESMALGDRVREAQELLKTPEELEEQNRKELARLDEDELYLLRESQDLALDQTKPKKPEPPKIPEPPPDLSLKFDPEPDPQS